MNSLTALRSMWERRLQEATEAMANEQFIPVRSVIQMQIDNYEKWIVEIDAIQQEET